MTRSSRELVRRVYLAVRDQYWDTVPPVISSSEVRQDGDAVAAVITGTHDNGEIGLTWRAEIDMRTDGIQYQFAGTATRQFSYANIGLCIHHPTPVLLAVASARSAAKQRRGAFPARSRPSASRTKSACP